MDPIVKTISDQDRGSKAVQKGLAGAIGKNTVLRIDGGNALWGYAQQTDIPCKVIALGRHVHEREPVFYLQNVNTYRH